MSNITTRPMTQSFRDARKNVVGYRYFVRRYLQQYLAANEQVHRFSRQKRKLEQAGISAPFIDAVIKEWQATAKQHHDRYIKIGECLFLAVDMWQNAGATLQELCNLCNKPYQQALKEIANDRLDETFSGLVFVYNLDYLHTDDDFISYDTDAPMTHAIKDFLLDQMVSNPAAREASHQAFAECFPDLMASALTPYVDQEGETRYMDADGNTVDIVKEGDQ